MNKTAKLLLAAAFAVSGVESFSAVIDDLTPLFRDTLTEVEKTDLFAMMSEIAALHGGPTRALFWSLRPMPEELWCAMAAEHQAPHRANLGN